LDAVPHPAAQRRELGAEEELLVALEQLFLELDPGQRVKGAERLVHGRTEGASAKRCNPTSSMKYSARLRRSRLGPPVVRRPNSTV